MPWNEKLTMKLREEFVLLAAQPGTNFSELCRRFSISRKTGYKWVARANNQESFNDRPRRPHHSPLQTSSDIELLIIKERQQHPEWGARKLKRRLENIGVTGLPAVSTITEILRRNDLLKTSSSPAKPNWQRFEHEHPNDLWQIDFKGPIGTRDSHGHALTVLDDHSRYSLGICITKTQTYEETKEHLSNVFRVYGLPYRITMDNGTPWGNPYAKWTRFTLWLLALDIGVSHSRPYHPQTQGKDERFHRTLKQELLERSQFYNLEHLQSECDRWREEYNSLRPHDALSLDVPVSRYQISHRPFIEPVREYEYGSEFDVRVIGNHGAMNYKGGLFHIGEVFRKLKVGVTPSIKDGEYDVYYRHQRISKINLRDK